MRERQRNKLTHPVRVVPGDKLICTIKDDKTGKTKRFTEEIGREMTIDTAVTFDLDKPAFGLKAGSIGAVFGEEQA